MRTERRQREVETMHTKNFHLREALRGVLELVLAIQEINPALFIPSLNYNQRVMVAKDVLGELPNTCPECHGTGCDPNPLNDPGPCNRCSGLGEAKIERAMNWEPIVLCPTDGTSWMLRTYDGSEFAGRFSPSQKRWQLRTGPEEYQDGNGNTIERTVWSNLPEGVSPCQFKPL